MQKLLELWKVDDSTLGSHFLQPSNSLSVNKHLSLYSEDPVLEQPHSLEDCDTENIGLRTSYGPEMVWSQSSTVESPDVQFCVKCRHANEEHANWCIECGTALMGTKIENQSGDDLSDLNGETSTELFPPQFDRVADQNPVSDIEINSLDLSGRHTHDAQTLNDQDGDDQAMVHTEYSICGDYVDDKQTTSVPKSPVRSYKSPIMSKTHPNNRTKKFHNTATNKNTTTSQLVTRKEYQRHWNTSSTYMWRKPSSIPNSTSCLVNDAHQLSNKNKFYTGSERHTSISVLPRKLQLVPILDLDAIDEGSLISTSVCSSIRTSSSINEVWTPSVIPVQPHASNTCNNCIIIFLLLD